jgi:hypothetical protein
MYRVFPDLDISLLLINFEWSERYMKPNNSHASSMAEVVNAAALDALG